jgi:hypothetical protein
MGYKKNDLYELTQEGLRVGEIIISSLRNVHSRQTEFDPKARKWAAKRLQSNFEKLNFEEYNKKIYLCFVRMKIIEEFLIMKM